jgi:phosphotransferase system HPr-like phosphotransfer protein
MTKKVLIGTIDSVKKFVNITTKQSFDIDLVSGRYVIDAKSIMGIFSLDLTKPIELRIQEDADAAEVETFLNEISFVLVD